MGAKPYTWFGTFNPYMLVLKNTLGFIAALLASNALYAQDADSVEELQTSISLYADVYYQAEPGNLRTQERPYFLYNFKRNNEFNLNLGLAAFSIKKDKVKANIGLMFGNYAQYNLAAEPALYRHVFEANINYSVSPKTTITAGIMPSHIGAESAISKDNWNLSRSLLAENSPYFETGLKAEHTLSDKWQFAVLLLNGWQNIQDNNRGKAIGTQIQFKPKIDFLINYSTFFGDESTNDSTRQLRFFNNFNSVFSLSTKLKTTLMLDFGLQERIASHRMNAWLGSAIMLQYLINKKFTIAGRLEYFKDDNNVIIARPPIRSNNFNIYGASLNLDYNITQDLSWRFESRILHVKGQILNNSGKMSNFNYSFLTALAIKL